MPPRHTIDEGRLARLRGLTWAYERVFTFTFWQRRFGFRHYRSWLNRHRRPIGNMDWKRNLISFTPFSYLSRSRAAGGGSSAEHEITSKAQDTADDDTPPFQISWCSRFSSATYLRRGETFSIGLSIASPLSYLVLISTLFFCYY